MNCTTMDRYDVGIDCVLSDRVERFQTNLITILDWIRQYTLYVLSTSICYNKNSVQCNVIKNMEIIRFKSRYKHMTQWSWALGQYPKGRLLKSRCGHFMQRVAHLDKELFLSKLSQSTQLKLALLLYKISCFLFSTMCLWPLDEKRGCFSSLC